MKERDYKYDNIRIILMFLVVFGHLIFNGESEMVQGIYLIIYSFHMPAFFFLTGFFAKFNGKKWIKNYFYTYIIFQTIYQLYYYYVVHEVDELVLQYTIPNYVLWYLFTLMMYLLLIPILESFDKDSLRNKLIAVGASIVISLMIDFDNEAGIELSFARCCNYLPFFVSGYYIGHGHIVKNGVRKFFSSCGAVKKIILTLILFMVSRWTGFEGTIKRKMVMGKFSYDASEGSVEISIILIAVAAIWILWLFVVIPSKKIPIISVLGRRTFSIFILHGFVIKYLRYKEFFHYSEEVNLLLALLIAVLMIAVFGNKYVYNAFMKIAVMPELPAKRVKKERKWKNPFIARRNAE